MLTKKLAIKNILQRPMGGAFTVLPALGLEEVAGTFWMLATCLSFQGPIKHGMQNLCASSSDLGQILDLGWSEL